MIQATDITLGASVSLFVQEGDKGTSQRAVREAALQIVRGAGHIEGWVSVIAGQPRWLPHLHPHPGLCPLFSRSQALPLLCVLPPPGLGDIQQLGRKISGVTVGHEGARREVPQQDRMSLLLVSCVTWSKSLNPSGVSKGSLHLWRLPEQTSEKG